MTNLQEAKLAREAEMCYATLALVTDYDCWHESHESVTVEQVIENLQKNAETARSIITRTIQGLDLTSALAARERAGDGHHYPSRAHSREDQTRSRAPDREVRFLERREPSCPSRSRLGGVRRAEDAHRAGGQRPRRRRHLFRARRLSLHPGQRRGRRRRRLYRRRAQCLRRALHRPRRASRRRRERRSAGAESTATTSRSERRSSPISVSSRASSPSFPRATRTRSSSFSPTSTRRSRST